MLVLGRAGVGKSSTVNQLLLGNQAPVGQFRPETQHVTCYNATIGTTPIRVVDTPGFADAGSGDSNDQRYIDEIAGLTDRVDLFLYVTTLDDTRVRRDERDTLELIHARFGSDIWERVVVLMTHADRFEPGAYEGQLVGRSDAFLAALRIAAPGLVSVPPVVATSNLRQTTPDGEIWLSKLWMACAGRVSIEGYPAFILSTVDRLEVRPSQQLRELRASRKRKRRPKLAVPANRVGMVDALSTSRRDGAPAVGGETSDGAVRVDVTINQQSLAPIPISSHEQKLAQSLTTRRAMGVSKVLGSAIASSVVAALVRQWIGT